MSPIVRKYLLRVLLWTFVLQSGINVARALDRFVVYEAPQPPAYEVVWRQLIGKPQARNIVLIAGVSAYPMLSATKQLSWVRNDIRILTNVFKSQGFDEIIVLDENDFNETNLAFLFEQHLPEVFRGAPGSRFVFAFSGHGFTDKGADGEGFLLKGNAVSLRDGMNAISFTRLRRWLEPLSRMTFQTLTLINSCDSGSLFM